MPSAPRRLLVAVCAVWLHGVHIQAQSVVEQPFASPPNPTGSGARALGQGNAFIAVADDATAASWNPAGLTQLEAPELSLAVEHLHVATDLASDAHPEADDSERNRTDALNYASFACPFQMAGRHWVASINYLALYRFEDFLDARVVTSGTGLTVDARHTIDQAGEFSALSPAIACDVTPRLALGLAVNVWGDGVTGASSYRRTTRSTGTVDLGLGPGRFTNLVDETFTVERGTSLTFGGLYRFDARWSAGLVVKPPFTLDLDHSSVTTLIQTAPLPTANSSAVDHRDSELRMPAVLGAGVACRISEPWSVALDLAWTDWSDYRRREDGQWVNPLTGRPGDSLHDTWTVRIGTEYVFVEDGWLLPVRCGIACDPSPSMDGSDPVWAASLGTGLQVGDWMWDVAYEYRWGDGLRRGGLAGLNATEDRRRHRLMTSLIRYF